MADIQYPRWRYRGDEAVLVKDEKEDKALGSGWVDNPAQTTKPADTPKPAK